MTGICEGLDGAKTDGVFRCTFFLFECRVGDLLFRAIAELFPSDDNARIQAVLRYRLYNFLVFAKICWNLANKRRVLMSNDASVIAALVYGTGWQLGVTIFAIKTVVSNLKESKRNGVKRRR